MINSFLVPIQIDNHAYIVLDTVFKNRHVICSLGVGRIEDGDALLTETGQQTLDAFAAYVSANDPETTLIFWEIGTKDRTISRLIKGFNFSLEHQKASIFFICADPTVYDAVFKALGVDASAISCQ